MSKKVTAHEFRRFFVFLLKVLIILIPSLMFFYVVKNFMPSPFYRKGNYLATFFYLIILIININTYDALEIGITPKRDLQVSFVLATTLTNILAYILVALIARSLLNALPMVVLTLLQYVVGIIMYEFSVDIYQKLYPPRETVIIYSDNIWDIATARKFEAQKERYNIKSVVLESAGLDKIKAEIDKYGTVIIGGLELNKRRTVFDYCYKKGKRIFVIPNIDDVIMQSAHAVRIDDSIVHLVKDRVMSTEQRIIKRTLDIIFSLLFLIITLPITLITAIAIKAYDGGPIFFRQTRLTKNGKEFDIIKFRSMIVDAEKDGAQFTTENDERITPVGKFIRKTRIDEIPQFINVLIGDMTVVGPRAERVENYELYTKMMPEFFYRTKVKAGVTGFAQIYGRYNTSFEAKAKMDIYYIENMSLITDLKLILSTVKVIFTSDSTEGFDSGFFDEEDLEEKSHELEEKLNSEAKDD